MSLHRSLSRIPKTLIPTLHSPTKPIKNGNPFHKLLPFFQIHYNSVNTHASSNDNNQNSNPQNALIKLEAERICKILLNTTCSTKGVADALSSVSGNVNPLLVDEVVKKLSNSGVLALSFFRWAEKQNGFVHTSESYHGLIEALGKIKQFKMVWILVDELKKKGLLCKESFALISRRYARARKVKEAIEAFERMEKYGLVVELQDFNRLLDTLSKSRNVGKAQEVFDKWKNKRKFKPNIKSYTILLEGWGGEKNLLRLNEVYQEMKADDIEPDVVSYGIMIHAHCKVKKYGEAIELLREMERKKIRVTPHVYCTLINGLGSEKRLVEALKYFELYKGSGFDLEVFTFNAMVGAYCWSMRMDDAYKLLDEMRRSKIGPNTRTYDIILHHLIKARRTNEAYLVFQKMSNDPGCEPTVSTYEIMVRMFCNEDRTDMALRVWDQMKARGVLPGMHMFSTLINSFCHENRLDDACTYFQEMLDMGMRPPLPLFDNLKRALPEEGKEDTVKALWRKLEKLRKSNLVG